MSFNVLQSLQWRERMDNETKRMDSAWEEVERHRWFAQPPNPNSGIGVSAGGSHTARTHDTYNRSPSPSLQYYQNQKQQNHHQQPHNTQRYSQQYPVAQYSQPQPPQQQQYAATQQQRFAYPSTEAERAKCSDIRSRNYGNGNGNGNTTMYRDTQVRDREGAQTAREFYHARPPVTLHSLRSGEPPLYRKRPTQPNPVDMGLPPVDITMEMRTPARGLSQFKAHTSGLPSGCEDILINSGGRKLCAITRWKEDLLLSSTRI